MKSQVWTLGFCLLAFLVVSGKAANSTQNKHHNVKVIAARPTEAPLMKSTVKPTMAPVIAAMPTKSIALPKSGDRQEEKGSAVNATRVKTDSEALESKIKLSSDTFAPTKKESLKSQIHVRDAKPVQVTGFITKNGNIYEIEDKDGIGMIEGRQSSVDTEMNVCNYGSVVVYSDVPCDQMTNIQVSDVIKTPSKEEKEQNEQISNVDQNHSPNQNSEDNDNNAGAVDGPNGKPPIRRRKNKNRKRLQKKKRNRSRRNKNRRTSANQTQRQKQRRTQSQQKRRRQQQKPNRRRLSNQQLNSQRRQQNYNRLQERPNRRTRGGNGNRKRYSTRNTINRNRRRGQNFHQAGRRQPDYEWTHFDEDY